MILLNTAKKPYGPIPGSFDQEIDSGYVTFVGENNSGKSSLLQLAFKTIFEQDFENRDKVCFVPKHRDFINPSTESGGTRLRTINQNVHKRLQEQPMHSNDPGAFRVDSLFSVILNHDGLYTQMGAVTNLLLELGFPEYVIRNAGKHFLSGVSVPQQGSGFRNIMPIVAAVTCPALEYILIDEPEASLEASKLKKMRDLFIRVCREQNKTIIVTTHSHLLLNTEDYSQNFLVSKGEGRSTSVRSMEERDVFSVAYKMLGHAPSDLYFPDNYLLVEGASDQVVVERVIDLLNVTQNIRVFSCAGIESIQPTKKTLDSAFAPIVEGASPYSSIVVVLWDKPRESNVQQMNVYQELARCVSDRLFTLDEGSLESYLPELLYERANLNKLEVLEEIENAVSYRAKSVIKRRVSLKIAEFMTLDDLDSIPIITNAVKKSLELL